MADVGRINGDIRRQFDPRDRLIAELAARQHGVVARWQLVELGFGRAGIDHRVRAGKLHPLTAGVYAVGHRAVTRRGRMMAAVLACGPGALLSHRDAAELWELRQSSRSAIDVTVLGRNGRSRAGITVHRARQLHPDDRTVRDGIPVTSLVRTLLDLAEVLGPRQLRGVLEQAERLGLFDLHAIEAAMARSPGRRALRPLRALLRDAGDLAPETRSELERAFLDLCEHHDLPRPQLNVVVTGYDVDAFWPDQRLVVEVDSRGFHATRAAFERDRIRDADLQVAGYRVVRITYRRLTREPAAVAPTLRALLAVPYRARATATAARAGGRPS